MMTLNLANSHHEQVPRGRHARENQDRLDYVEHQDPLDRSRSRTSRGHIEIFAAKEVHRLTSQRIEQTEKMVCRYQVRLVFNGRSETYTNWLLVAEFWEDQMVGERDIDLNQRSTLLDR